MLQLFGYPNSRSTRITWLFEELGLEYQFKLVDFNKGEQQSPGYLGINPGGKLPAIKDGDFVMTESAAIVTYFSDAFADLGFIPATGTPDRAAYEQWSYFTLSELEQPLWTMGKHKFALPAEHRVKAVLKTAEWEFQKALVLLSQGLGEKPYILGDHFQSVDILLGHTLMWGLSFKQKIEQENLQAYIKRLQSREALGRAVAKEVAALDGKNDG